MTCISKDPPYWFRLNNPVSYVHIYRESLVLRQVKYKDSGIYICNGTDVVTYEPFSAMAELWVTSSNITSGNSD